MKSSYLLVDFKFLDAGWFVKPFDGGAFAVDVEVVVGGIAAFDVFGDVDLGLEMPFITFSLYDLRSIAGPFVETLL